MKSFNKHYNDLKPDLHASINNTFKLSEVKTQFIRKVVELLSKIYGDENLPYRVEEKINFEPKEQPYFSLDEDLKEFLNFSHTKPNYPFQIFFIENIYRLTLTSANSLLKFFEEP